MAGIASFGAFTVAASWLVQSSRTAGPSASAKMMLRPPAGSSRTRVCILAEQLRGPNTAPPTEFGTGNGTTAPKTPWRFAGDSRGFSPVDDRVPSPPPCTARQAYRAASSRSSAGEELAQRDLAAADQRLAVREQEVLEIEVEQPAKRLAQPGPHR